MRTTFKTRYDKRVRKDEQIVEESYELCQPLSDEKLVHIVEEESHSCFEFCNRKLCPQSTIEESQENQETDENGTKDFSGNNYLDAKEPVPSTSSNSRRQDGLERFSHTFR